MAQQSASVGCLPLEGNPLLQQSMMLPSGAVCTILTPTAQVQYVGVFAFHLSAALSNVLARIAMPVLGLNCASAGLVQASPSTSLAGGPFSKASVPQ